MQVTIYSTTTCATCHLVTSWLEKNKVPFTKKNTDVEPDAMVEFMSVNDGTIGVPFTVISSDDGSVTKILGFDQSRFKQALGM